MIIITTRLPKPKFALAVVGATVASSCFLVFALAKQPYETAMSHSDGVVVKTQNQRLDLLADYGWEVEEIPLSTETLLIPVDLDESYEEYLALQASQGFPSLENFAGQEVERYTYQILNYPTGEEGIQVNLLLHKETLIGGEVLSPQIGGFIHGLSRP